MRAKAFEQLIKHCDAHYEGYWFDIQTTGLFLKHVDFLRFDAASGLCLFVQNPERDVIAVDVESIIVVRVEGDPR